MEKRWKIASIAGIPIYITVPWLLFAAFVVYGMYQSLAQTDVVTDQEALGWALANAALFYGSIVIHELAHAATARWFDIPVHGVTMVFWGGYTETHPTDRGPFPTFLVSAAGPLSTLALAGVFWLGALATDGIPSALLGRLAFLSLLFAGLNALPGYPLDGGRVLMAAAWGLTKDRSIGLRVAGWGGVVVGAALGVVAIQMLRSGDGFALFLGFIGWVMISQGIQVMRQIPLLRDLSEGRVAQAMSPAPPPIPATATLLQALDTHLRTDRSTEFPVVDDDGRVVGALSFPTAASVGRDDPTRVVRDAMIPRERMRHLTPELPLDRALERTAGVGPVLVIDEDRPVGRLTTGDIDRWYRRRLAGGDGAETVPPRPDLGGVGDWG